MKRPTRPRPIQVTIAVALVALSCVVQIAMYAWALQRDPAAEMWFVAANIALSIAAAGAILFALYAGHRWAQWVVIGFTAFGIPRDIVSLLAAPDLMSGGTFFMGLAVGLATCTLLLMRPSREWYKTVDR